MGVKQWIARRALVVAKTMDTSYYEDDNVGGHPGHAEHHHHHGTILDLGPGEGVNTSGIAVWMIGLICFTIGLEKMLHKLIHKIIVKSEQTKKKKWRKKKSVAARLGEI